MRLISRLAVWSAEAVEASRSFIDKGISFINSFVVAILTPEEIASYTKQFYENQSSPYGDPEWIDKGLNPSEQDLIEKHAVKNGSFIVLGCGGGREATALARMGFDVTGIDSSEKMILKAKEYAAKEGLKVDVLKGDFLEMPFSKGAFDHCLLTCFMYSVIPSREMRVALLSNVHDILTDRGIAIIHFMTASGDRRERLLKLRKAVARIFRGNVSYQMGDSFHPPSHFFRHFLDEREVIDEVRKAGLFVKEILKCQHSDNEIYAVLEKIGHQ
jgi:SAM-dependent methyltransferase